MNEIVDSNLDKEMKTYEENRKKFGDKIFELDPNQIKNDEISNSRKNYYPYEYFDSCFGNSEKEYLKNSFMTYSSDDVIIL